MIIPIRCVVKVDLNIRYKFLVVNKYDDEQVRLVYNLVDTSDYYKRCMLLVFLNIGHIINCTFFIQLLRTLKLHLKCRIIYI